jgi:hypothetical protein
MRISRWRDMNMRPQFLVCIFGITLLSGCELAVIPIALVVEPVVYAVVQSKVVQPVTVVSSSGELLTPGFTDTAKEEFIVSEKTIVCNGFHFLEKDTREVSLVCNNGLKGKVAIEKKYGREIRMSIGQSGYLTEAIFRCHGYYNKNEGRVDPFLIDCGNDGKAAVSPVEGGEYPSEFKVWFHPPSNALFGFASQEYNSLRPWKFNCLAANQNHPYAQALVADHYRHGSDPVERDVLRAYVWYRLAELNGYEGRQNLRTKLETGGWTCCTAKPYSEALAVNMTPSELADGERLVSEWKPNPAECEREAKLAAD